MTSHTLDCDQPLFAPPKAPRRAATELRKHPTAPSIRWGYCPGHQDHTSTTGLVLVDGHLAWRAHDIVSYGGLRRPCSAAGKTVHDAPPTGARRPVCVCEAPA